MRLFLSLVFLILTICAKAGFVNREQARAKAHHFLMEKGRNRQLKDAETRTKAVRSRGMTLPDYYYVFNAEGKQGFVIVSADDRTPEILGYCSEGSFDADEIPPNMAAWLQGYEDQIKYLQENDNQPVLTRSYGESMPAVAPLLKTKWDQGRPYNNKLPTYDGYQCITGCTATALAQVMYYYQYPTGMTTEIPGYTTTKNRIKVNSLPATTFNWSQMVSSYSGNSTWTQDEAVAHLMEYCSKAILSDFDPYGTGSYSYLQRDALINYFGYDKGLKLKDRNSMTNGHNCYMMRWLLVVLYSILVFLHMEVVTLLCLMGMMVMACFISIGDGVVGMTDSLNWMHYHLQVSISTITRKQFLE